MQHGFDDEDREDLIVTSLFIEMAVDCNLANKLFVTFHSSIASLYFIILILSTINRLMMFKIAALTFCDSEMEKSYSYYWSKTNLILNAINSDITNHSWTSIFVSLDWNNFYT